MNTTVEPMRLLREFLFADKLEHRFGRPRSEEATERRIRLQDRWNEFAYDDEACEISFVVANQPSKGSTLCAVLVLKVAEGNWLSRYSAEHHNTSTCSPWDYGRIWATREKATRAGVGSILAWALRDSHRSDNSPRDHLDLRKIITASQAFLHPVTKNTLF